MTDFELQRQLRGLRTPQAPKQDLWPSIATRITAQNQHVQNNPRRWLPWAMAASIATALITGILFLSMRPPLSLNSAPFASIQPADLNVTQITQQARQRSQNTDPRLMSAAVELDTAHTELQQALESNPRSVFLVDLLNRTQAQRLKLQQLGVKTS